MLRIRGGFHPPSSSPDKELPFLDQAILVLRTIICYMWVIEKIITIEQSRAAAGVAFLQLNLSIS